MQQARAHAAQGGVTLGPEQGELEAKFLLSWRADSHSSTVYLLLGAHQQARPRSQLVS
jgi:hypothetical protein